MRRVVDAEDIELELYKFMKLHLSGEISRGEMLKALRKEVLKMSQSRYCKLAKIGRNVLVNIERDQGEPTEASLRKAFRPFLLQPAMVRFDLGFMRKSLNL